MVVAVTSMPGPAPASPTALPASGGRSLAERAAAPSDLVQPAAVGGLAFRPLAVADAAAIHALWEACAPVDRAEERSSVEEVTQELTVPWLSLATDSLGGVDETGTLRAFAVANRRPAAAHSVQVHLLGTVHPRWRGLGVGRALLGWQVGRSRQLLAAAAAQHLPGRIRVDLEDANVTATARVRAAGFAPARYFTTMRRRLGAELPDPQLPAGVRLAPLSTGASSTTSARDPVGPPGGDPRLLEAVRVAHNEAFAQHWGSDPFDPEQWQQRVVSSAHRRLDLSLAALDPDDRVLGYLVSGTYEQDWEPQGFSEGWVDLLGVAPTGRRHGVGSALLATACQAFRAEGLEYAGLGVDVDNPAALDLYLSLGFAATSRGTSWTIEV